VCQQVLPTFPQDRSAPATPSRDPRFFTNSCMSFNKNPPTEVAASLWEQGRKAQSKESSGVALITQQSFRHVQAAGRDTIIARAHAHIGITCDGLWSERVPTSAPANLLHTQDSEQVAVHGARFAAPLPHQTRSWQEKSSERTPEASVDCCGAPSVQGQSSQLALTPPLCNIFCFANRRIWQASEPHSQNVAFAENEECLRHLDTSPRDCDLVGGHRSQWGCCCVCVC
jgi:hypothetical protein